MLNDPCQKISRGHTVVVLGGYGNFGTRIAAALAQDDIRVLIAGRNQKQAMLTSSRIGNNAEPLLLDHHSADLSQQLQRVNAQLLIHTAGPFQAQDYRVAQACIDAKCHYIDIADGRAFVSGISTLDAYARANNTLVVAGASSLPALSAAVVDHYYPEFSHLDSIEHAISAGAKSPGIATMVGVLSYAGKPFKRWEAGQWITVFGLQGVIQRRFPGLVGKRWLINFDVPDLELLQQRYADVQSVIFRAGIGFTATTFAMVMLSWLVRVGVIDNLARYSKTLHAVATQIESLGSQWSAMEVKLQGLDREKCNLTRTWHLIAGDDHGPNVPCLPAIALTRKLLRGEIATRGAMPCMGLLSTKEILDAMPNLNLRIFQS